MGFLCPESGIQEVDPRRGFGFSRAGVKVNDEVTIRPKQERVSGERWVRGVGEEEEVEIEMEGADESAVGDKKVKKMQDPLLPSEKEVQEHQVTHLPFRSWCPHCVKGRAKEMHHRRQPHTERGVDEFHLDYCFPGDEFGFKLTVLVGVERHTGMKLASVVPTKGATVMFAARRVVELMNECGNRDTNVIVRTDQEPAIKFLVADVLKLRTGAKTMVAEAPKRSSGSNGFVERAVQTCEGYIRSLKSQLDERYVVKIDIGHPIVTWLCEYASYLLNRLEVGRDGKTSYERIKASVRPFSG